MGANKEDPLYDILIWMIKVIVVIYAVVIVGSLISVIFLGAGVEDATLASITTLLTTALGGIFAAIVRRNRRSD